MSTPERRIYRITLETADDWEVVQDFISSVRKCASVATDVDDDGEYRLALWAGVVGFDVARYTTNQAPSDYAGRYGPPVEAEKR